MNLFAFYLYCKKLERQESLIEPEVQILRLDLNGDHSLQSLKVCNATMLILSISTAQLSLLLRYVVS